MSDENPIRGESVLVLNGTEYILVYDWTALAKLSKRYGGNANLFEPETLAGALEIGLAKHHKDVTAQHIIEASPPLVDAIAAFNNAMKRSYFGHKEPPPDAAENPLVAAMATGQMNNSAESRAPMPSHSAQGSAQASSGG